MTQRGAIADTMRRTIELGVTIPDAAENAETAPTVCQVLDAKDTCPECGRPGRLREHVLRKLADLPIR
ncbi:hypothetical protein [Gordonia bronchialis]|uniref:hypothetical protein n=1 Tax=Gordonia bronchialis TaxID=2054 RepID=UPI00226E8D3D|nr:hypothetical protein [Gordonia bronchialis]